MSFVVFFSLSLYFPLLRLTRLAVLPKQLFFSSLPLCSSPLLSSVRPSWLLQVAALHHKTSVRLGFLSLFRPVPALSLFQNLLIFPLVFFRLQSHSFLVTRSCLALVFTSITTSRYLGLLTSLPPGSYLCRTMRHRGDAEVSVRVCVCVCLLLRPFNRTARHSRSPTRSVPCHPRTSVLLSLPTKTSCFSKS